MSSSNSISKGEERREERREKGMTHKSRSDEGRKERREEGRREKREDVEAPTNVQKYRNIDLRASKMRP